MAKDVEVKPKRTRRTKAEIQQEFEGIVSSTSERESLNSKTEELVRQQEHELLASVKDVVPDEMIRKFAELNIEISKTLTNLSDKIVNEIQFLAKLRQAGEIEKKEIERLHKIDVAKTSLDLLIDEYQEQKEELEIDISTQRSQWEEEKQQYELENEEQDETLQKSRKRENEEYEYKKNLERKKAQDKYDEEIRLRDKHNKEHQETLEKSWRVREESLKSQEEELLSLRKTVQEFPAKLQKEVDRSVQEAIKRTEQQQSQQLELLKRERETEARIAELRIKALEDILTKQTSQMSSMQAQMEEAKKQVQDIAVKAIEGASGSRALSHINQIAMEQAKGRPGQL